MPGVLWGRRRVLTTVHITRERTQRRTTPREVWERGKEILSNVDIRYTIEELLTLYHANGIAPDLVGREDARLCDEYNQ